jgi:hypothetical protein
MTATAPFAGVASSHYPQSVTLTCLNNQIIHPIRAVYGMRGAASPTDVFIPRVGNIMDFSERIFISLISVAILMVLALQAFAGFIDTGRWGWPFLAYPMYKTAHHDGERILHDFTLYAKTADGDRIEVTRDDLGLGFWHFEKFIFAAIRQGDLEKPQIIANEYCKRHNRRIVGLVLEDKGIAISRSGMVTGLPPQVLAAMNVRCE